MCICPWGNTILRCSELCYSSAGTLKSPMRQQVVQVCQRKSTSAQTHTTKIQSMYFRMETARMSEEEQPFNRKVGTISREMKALEGQRRREEVRGGAGGFKLRGSQQQGNDGKTEREEKNRQ